VVTVLLVTENVALVEPALTVTLAATVAADVLPLVRLTDVSVEGAPVNVTVPCDVLPPVMLLGLSTSDDRLGVAAGGVMVQVAVVDAPFSDAEIVAT
jgi:hypothetical protein